ncbi:MAG: DNA photolyase [Gammaproteobacteria bacterium]|nr:DNA photolyase [Gammaproteobacteria bacterium]
MGHTVEYQTKFDRIASETLFSKLDPESRHFVHERAFELRFTLQELRLVSQIARDLEMWNQGGIATRWPDTVPLVSGPEKKKLLLKLLQERWEDLKNTPNHYSTETGQSLSAARTKFVGVEKDHLGLGYCPVASPRTRCCNLMTLDVVDNCGYGCNYCSIQSFFDPHQVSMDRNFAEKLAALPIDPNRTYHIGTGQSSDSLMWGNSGGTLDALIDFAEKHPNIILELKTKSANVGHLLKRRPPANMICTWSLNPPPVIANEELGTAPLDKRLKAARKLSDQGTLVGFHLHPMIRYDDWDLGYPALIAGLQKMFAPDEVAMVSLGTLTFIKPVIRQIREQGMKSQILKLPLVEADGKLSYPDEVKLEMFSTAYESFSQKWRQEVFFYLCMENHRFWKPVFGYEYPSNELFETSMKHHYMEKIRTRT